ncbi:MAG: hypothetical protein QNJ65_03470 [Xenococcaceae cyanobacterium MO_234.B1]|nr:hypothetical protein [Xenococcaceae cyanobacterium MO_234.B1]
METLEKLEAKQQQQLAELSEQISETKDSEKIKKLKRKITTVNDSLEAIAAYKSISVGHVVCNSNPEKLGKVCSKELQNELPVIWVDWDGTQVSCVPSSLTVIPEAELEWQWIDNSFIRLYDRKPCDDFSVLLQELQSFKNRLKTTKECGSFPKAIGTFNDCIQEIKRLWELAVKAQMPIDSGFSLHNRKVAVKKYHKSKQHDNLLFPVVFDGSQTHLAHPVELQKIPLGQINMFPEDNADPDEPDENSEVRKSREPLIIDPEFKSLIPPLNPDERLQLEENLKREGCRDPLVIWKGHNILLDGHNRYDLCSIHNIPYNTVEIELEDPKAVNDWIIYNQLGRRNLSKEVISYLRGKLYNSLKQSHGGLRNKTGINQHSQELINCSSSSGQNVHLSKTPKTGEDLAKKEKVNEKTIRRDAKYAESIDRIVEKIGGSPHDVLNSKLSKKQVQELREEPPEMIKQKLANPHKVITPRELPKLTVGQLVQIKSGAKGNRQAGRTNPDLVGYNKSYAVVKELRNNCADIEVWGQPLKDIGLQFLEPVEDKTYVCANIDPEFLVLLMQNYSSFNEAVKHIPINEPRTIQAVS